MPYLFPKAGPLRTWIVRELARACDETVHLAILTGNEVLYIAKEEGTNTIRMASAMGKRFPAHGTGVGKMLLAALDPAELDQLYPPAEPLAAITPHTITDPQAFRRELAETRRRGYATDLEESTPGLCCVAAPIEGRGTNLRRGRSEIRRGGRMLDR